MRNKSVRPKGGDARQGGEGRQERGLDMMTPPNTLPRCTVPLRETRST